MSNELDAASIAALLQKTSRQSKPVQEKKERRPATPEEIAAHENLVNSGDAYATFGPLRITDTSGPCTHTYVKGERRYNCGSQTSFKLKGVRRCTVHALREMNLMLVNAGVE